MVLHTPLIATIVAGIVLAFVFGTIAHHFRVSRLAGYLLAGVAVGPFTPGFVADQALANELAEIGVILLMFGVGLQFSQKNLLSVWSVAIPGAAAQIVVAVALAAGIGWHLRWPLSGSLLFGLALSVASTVVLLRFLQERRLIQTERGRIAVGWLVAQDLIMVLALVLIPPIAALIGVADGLPAGAAPSPGAVMAALAVTLGKVIAFVAVMLIVGRRVIPWILHYIAHTGSRELFRLAVLAIALGVAYGGAVLFGVSFALGAFFAGLILSGSELSQRAAEESLPLRDAFAVLFFVSVGMLFDPRILLRDPWPLMATLFIIVLGKSVAAYLVVRLFGYPVRTALMIAASLAQIGEFSFILATLGVGLDLLPAEGRDLVLAGAILSILANPALLYMVDRYHPHAEREAEPPVTREPLPTTALRDHAVLVGFGRVGGVIAERLRGIGVPFYVVDDSDEIVDRARAQGFEAQRGNAADAALLQAANIAGARWLFVAIPNGFEAGQIVAQAKAANPAIDVIARAHSDAEVTHLQNFGANSVILGERETAIGMFEVAFPRSKGQAAPTASTA